jgi:hypothetical protein
VVSKDDIERDGIDDYLDGLPPEIRTLTPTLRAYARSLGLDGDTELEYFQNHVLANGLSYCNWDAGFRAWLRRAVEYKRLRKAKGWFRAGEE